MNCSGSWRTARARSWCWSAHWKARRIACACVCVLLSWPPHTDGKVRLLERERDAGRERGEQQARIAALQATLSDRDFEVARLQRQHETLAGRLERSKSVIDAMRAGVQPAAAAPTPDEQGEATQ